ncbi:hypothetical protein ACFPIF_15750 [Brevundimonas faecalis]|uniref:hypothetical protein n=1 Tax=Brevundimonas faecalis TaxID=947378 RepID=UPI00361DB27D
MTAAEVVEAAADLPMPRLQMRWQKLSETERNPVFGAHDWLCHYELILPLAEHDIRREVYEDGEQVSERDHLTIAMKEPSVRGCSDGNPPCQWRGEGEVYYDAPYRDGAHAEWDAKLLGNLPVFVIAPDGTALRQATPATGQAGGEG